MVKSIQSQDVKNPILKQRVLSGEISPESLAEMTPQQLANAELVNYRKAREMKSLEGVLLNFALQLNNDQVLVQEGMAPDVVSEKRQAEKAVKTVQENLSITSSIPSAFTEEESYRGSYFTVKTLILVAKSNVVSTTPTAGPLYTTPRATQPAVKLPPKPAPVIIPQNSDMPKDWHGLVDRPGFQRFAVFGKHICGRVIDPGTIPPILEISGRLATEKLLTCEFVTGLFLLFIVDIFFNSRQAQHVRSLHIY